MKRILITLLLFSCLHTGAFGQKNISTKSSADILNEGIQLHERGKYANAISLYKSISVNDTNYAMAQYEAALSYIADEEYFFARKILKDLLKLETPYKDRARVYTLLGQSYDGDGKFEEAMQAYDEGLKYYPMNNSLYYAKGITCNKFEKHQEAYDNFKKAVLCNVNHANAHMQLGVITAREGHLAEALMCFMTYLLIAPEASNAAQIVGFMETIADGSYTPEPKGITISTDGDDFENLNLFIQNKIALQSKYKVKLSYETAFGKQMHLIGTNVKPDLENKGFFQTVYVPLFHEICEKNLLDGMVLSSLRPINNDKIQKKINSKRAVIQNFLGQGQALWFQHGTHRFMDYQGSVQKVFTIYNDDGLIYGQLDENGKGNGKFYFYFPDGNLKAEGVMEHGDRVGEWIFYNDFTFKKSEVNNYRNGKLHGLTETYYASGELEQRSSYRDGLVEDTIFLYYRNGTVEKKIGVKQDKRHGIEQAYYRNGAKRYELFYKEGVAEGQYQAFYPNGSKYEIFNLVNDEKDGLYTRYYYNQNKQFEQNYTQNKLNGELKNWYINGQIESEGTLKDGHRIGTFKDYYFNGTLSALSQYDENGKENGSSEFYDRDGKKFMENKYKKGFIESIVLLERNGIPGKTIESRGKKIEYVSIHTNGFKNAEGLIVEDKKQGIWKYYDVYGNLVEKETYNNGMLEDTSYTYYPNGNIKSKCRYHEDKRTGLYVLFSETGVLLEEGMYKDDERSNDWYNYYENGNLRYAFSYKNGNRDGINREYASNGKLTLSEWYENDNIIATIYLDTNGVEYSRSGEYQGLVELKDFTNSFVRFKGNFKNGVMDGLQQWFYPDGKVLQQGIMINGNRDGEWVWYYQNGKPKTKIDYKLGVRDGKHRNYHESGQVSYEADFINDENHGTIKFYYETGKIEIASEYVYGVRHGKSINYHQDGSLAYIRYYENDQLVAYTYLDAAGKEVTPIKLGKDENTFTCYFQNGKKSIEQTRKNGQLEGKYVQYHTNGNIKLEEFYYCGNQTGMSTEYYPDGKKKIETNYLNDLKNGLEITYHPNGQIKTKQVFNCGEAHGPKEFYDTTGKLIQTIYYYDDAPFKIVQP